MHFQTVTDSKIKKIEVSTKDLLCKHKKCVAKHIWYLSPLVPLLIPDKIPSFFIFSFFIEIWAHNFNVGWTPQPLLLATKQNQKMADNVCPQTRSSVGRGIKPLQKNVARSRSLATNINVNTTNPPNNNKKSKLSSDPSKTPALTTSPPKGQL